MVTDMNAGKIIYDSNLTRIDMNQKLTKLWTFDELFLTLRSAKNIHMFYSI